MTYSINAINLIKAFEGLELKAYQDQKGIWTVGYGATGYGIGPETVWTEDQAIQNLSNRVAGIAAQVTAAVGLRVNQNQFDALCSLAYNIGPNAFRGSILVNTVNKRQYLTASLEFLKWDHINGVESKGLLRRREAEKALFMSNSP